MGDTSTEHGQGADETGAPNGSEIALADEFCDRYSPTWRYVAERGEWRFFDGRVWGAEKTLEAFDLAREVARAAAARAESRTAMALATAKTVAAIEKLARADRRVAATIDQWDADPWVLNTPDGVVDLPSGAIRPHESTDYTTKITAVGPGGDCARWHAFLDRITNGDHDLQAFLQRMSGYALSGSTREHALFFLFGEGNNGKSIFIKTLAGMLGDYAVTAAMSTFTEQRNEGHPTELARLCGARLVTATETEEGRAWNESRIKEVTGGDTISARFMRQDFFEFVPAFKLLFSGNHKPSIRNVGKAMRRRINLVPFTVTIPDAEVDKALDEKLRDEWPGILAWAIEGCRAWQRDGLRPPAAVLDATDGYFGDEDLLGQFLSECTEKSAGYELSGQVFGAHQRWMKGNNEVPWSQKKLTGALQDRGYRAGGAEKEGGKRVVRGLRLTVSLAAAGWSVDGSDG